MKDKIVLWFKNNPRKAISFYVILIILIPILVWISYPSGKVLFFTQISADGMLSYFATAIGSGVALLVGLIALYEGDLNRKQLEQLEIDKRRKSIRPNVSITIEKQYEESTYFNIEISNYSMNVARKVCVWDSLLFYAIKNESKYKFISFNEEVKDASIQYVHEYDYKLNDYGYPKTLTLIYFDVDDNIIKHTFICLEENNYETLELEYM